jgi:glycine/D-amino acid oxidase-like deaminating enzyme
VQAAGITLAYAQGAVSHGAHLIEGRPVGRLICQGQRVVGVETTQGPMHGEIVVLAAGAWTSQWHTKTLIPPIFPAKGQMMALQAPPGFHLRHTIYASGVGGIVPKSGGTIYVGSTVEQVGFDKVVTAGGIAILLAAVAKLTPGLNSARFVGTWAGLRPASADGLPAHWAKPKRARIMDCGGLCWLHVISVRKRDLREHLATSLTPCRFPRRRGASKCMYLLIFNKSCRLLCSDVINANLYPSP